MFVQASQKLTIYLWKIVDSNGHKRYSNRLNGPAKKVGVAMAYSIETKPYIPFFESSKGIKRMIGFCVLTTTLAAFGQPLLSSCGKNPPQLPLRTNHPNYRDWRDRGPKHGPPFDKSPADKHKPQRFTMYPVQFPKASSYITAVTLQEMVETVSPVALPLVD